MTLEECFLGLQGAEIIVWTLSLHFNIVVNAVHETKIRLVILNHNDLLISSYFNTNQHVI